MKHPYKEYEARRDCLKNYAKKVKVDADFKVANSSEIIQEIKNRVDSFKKIYFLLGTSFSQIFKAHFDTSKLSLQIQSSGNLSMKYIKECHLMVFLMKNIKRL